MTTHPETGTHRALTERRYPDQTGWFDRHSQAVGSVLMAPTQPLSDSVRNFEAAILLQLRGLAMMAGAHVRRYEAPIAHDGFIGPAFCQALAALRAMLNGELGRLDGGTLDHAILELHEAAGFEGEL